MSALRNLVRSSVGSPALDAGVSKLTGMLDKIMEHPFQTVLVLLGLLTVAWVVHTAYHDRRIIPGYPVVGEVEGWDFFRNKARLKFIQEGQQVVLDAQAKYGEDAIFQAHGHSMPILIIPVKYMNELRNHEDLVVNEAGQQDFFPHYAPFYEIQQGTKHGIMVHAIKTKLTPALPLIIPAVNEESNLAIPKCWPPTGSEWRENRFVESLQLLVSQLSSRVFLGDKICRDEKWIEIAKNYSVDVMAASFDMQVLPRLTRPFLYRFMPSIIKLQQTVAAARAIIEPEIRRRQKGAIEARQLAPKFRPKHLDSLDWLIDVALDRSHERTYDFASGQMSLSFAAIHTTSSTAAHLMYDIIQYNLVDELRQEIITEYQKEGGWGTVTLFNMRLMDSVMKESQRLNSFSFLNMNRFTTKDVRLSDGAVIPKNTRFVVPNNHILSDENWKDARRFNARRFVELRDTPGNSKNYQFVTPTVQHNSFGLGKHSCPGRYFASNEIKIIMSHLLLKYDWKFVQDRPTKSPYHNGWNVSDPTRTIMYRSREPEIHF